MAVYQYVASNMGGKIKKGQITTANPEQLRELLKQQKLFLISYEEKANLTSGRKLKANELSELCRELSSLLGSGVSVVRSFTIISGRDIEPKLKKSYANITTLIKRGVPLSDAMEMQGRMFPEMLVNMIRAGEESGRLDQTFEKMSVHYEKEYRMTGAVKSALTYPIVLLVLIVVVMMALFTFVLPTFFELFEDMEVPLITQIVMNISTFVRENVLIIILLGAILVMLIGFIAGLYPVKYQIDRILLKLPKISPLIKIVYTAQFARTLASLYASGINIVDSLQISRNTIPNYYIREQFDDAVRKIRAGNTLSETLKEIDGFDIKLSQTTEIGEETGQLDKMLNSTASSYEYESQAAINKMITILQPVMIVILAGLVLVVIGAVMLPIFNMYSSIEGASDPGAGLEMQVVKDISEWKEI
ncbi:MAG: type II secretion system F family protein [Oscillospiraceae bacterium]|nr:type II secretion system F family protein [Oscillospiraceae bacterium]